MVPFQESQSEESGPIEQSPKGPYFVEEARLAEINLEKAITSDDPGNEIWNTIGEARSQHNIKSLEIESWKFKGDLK